MEPTKVDYEKGAEIARAAIKMQNSKATPFNQPTELLYPDNAVPEGIEKGSREHALYLFHGCALDSNRKAAEVYKAARRLAMPNRDLTQLHRLNIGTVERILGDAFGIPKKRGREIFDAARALRENSRKLEENYDSDPRNIRKEDVWETIDEIDKFTQYGPGKAALLMKNYVRFGIWQFNETEIPIKIDRHLTRICLSNAVIDPKEFGYRVGYSNENPKALIHALEQSVRLGYFKEDEIARGEILAVRSEQFVMPLMKMFQEITKTEKLSAVSLNDALWAIGSQLCSKNSRELCHHLCKINCPTRYPSDNNTTWFFIKSGDKTLDKRNGQSEFLF